MQCTKSNYSFKDLCNGSGEGERDGEPFRSFVYALSIPFSQRKCQPLSPAVLLFLIKKDKISFFDAVINKLPIAESEVPYPTSAKMKGYNSTRREVDPKLALSPQFPAFSIPVIGELVADRWVCKCKRKIGNVIDLNMDHLTFSETHFATADIVNAVATVDLPEKFNCIALLSGIVNFDKIGEDVIRTNVCDNSIKPLPGDSMKDWNQNHKFEEWKKLVRGSIDNFRRPYMLFDSYGRFVTRKSFLDAKDNFKSRSEKVDMPEYVFFSVNALKKLLSESETISAAFIDNHTISVAYAGSDSFREAFNSNPEKYSYLNVKTQKFRTTFIGKLHPFWILKEDCKNNGCVSDI